MSTNPNPRKGDRFRGVHTAQRKRRSGEIRKERLDLSPTLEAMIRSDLSDAIMRKKDRSTTVSERFKAEYLGREIFSKYLDPSMLTGPEERKTAAIKKWLAAELRNETTNVRLYSQSTSFPWKGKSIPTERIIEVARSTILRVLGETPDLEVLYGTFTNGASTKFTRGPGVIAKKFMDEAHVTASAHPWFRKIYAELEGWRAISDDVRGLPLTVEIVRGNVLFTVPKTSEIDRVAAKEPGLNMFLQKGVGDFLRRQLRSVLRQDLDDQTVNQQLARQGSLTGKLATLDLSSASDLISHQLIFALLPLDWFHLLNDIRSRETFVEGEWKELNMFSSMGNAFTFELETLVFWALVNALCYLTGIRGTISVYGDDIICPSAVAGLVDRVFSWFGFKVNPKKSFWRGPFRESCGKHWHMGIDVTPFYVKEPIVSMPRLIHFLNRLRYWAGQGGKLDASVFPLWDAYRDRVPRTWRGGKNLNDISQLVTDESPDCSLRPATRRFNVDVTGSYLSWLRMSDGRATACGVFGSRELNRVHLRVVEPLETSKVLVETKSFKSCRLPLIEKHQQQIHPGYLPGWP